MNHRETFVQYYEAYFGRWYPAGKPAQEALWWRLVDKVPVAQYDNWFRRVVEHWGMRQGAPKLRAFEICLRGLEVKDVSERIPYCNICECRGVFIVPARWDEEKKAYSFDEFQGVLSMTAFPCSCKYGERYSRHRPPKEVWETAFNVWRDIREACNCPYNSNGYEDRMSFEEFVKKYSKSCVSPIALMESICNDSRRTDAEKKGLDTSAYLPLKIDYTEGIKELGQRLGFIQKDEPKKEPEPESEWMF